MERTASGSAISRLWTHASGAAATFTIAWVMVQGVLLPVHRERVEVERQLSEWKALQARESEIRLQLAEAEASLARQEAHSNALRRVPETLDRDAVQAELATMARASGIELSVADITAPVPVDSWLASDIQLRAVCDYAELCRFLDALPIQPRLWQLTRLHVRKRSLVSNVLDAELSVRVYSAPLITAHVEGTRRE